MEVTGIDISFVDIWVTATSLCGALSIIASAYFYVQVYLGVRKSMLKKIRQVTALVQANQDKKVAKTTWFADSCPAVLVRPRDYCQ